MKPTFTIERITSAKRREITYTDGTAGCWFDICFQTTLGVEGELVVPFDLDPNGQEIVEADFQDLWDLVMDYYCGLAEQSEEN